MRRPISETSYIAKIEHKSYGRTYQRQTLLKKGVGYAQCLVRLSGYQIRLYSVPTSNAYRKSLSLFLCNETVPSWDDSKC